MSSYLEEIRKGDPTAFRCREAGPPMRETTVYEEGP